MPKVKNPSIVNEHGIRLSEQKVSKVKSAFEKYNKKVNADYNKLRKAGIKDKIARMISGYNLQLDFDAFKSQKAVDETIESLKYKVSNKHRVQAREHITNSLLAFLEQRMGIGPRSLRRVEVIFRSMTMKEYNQWLNKNWDKLDELFTSYKKGIFNAIYDENEARDVLNRFMGGLRKWKMPRDIYK